MSDDFEVNPVGTREALASHQKNLDVNNPSLGALIKRVNDQQQEIEELKSIVTNLVGAVACSKKVDSTRDIYLQNCVDFIEGKNSQQEPPTFSDSSSLTDEEEIA